MNITKIELTNFLSHKRTIFDISNINPVIVVGDNGAGKSTLVKDSVTWALFGKARAGNDEVIHHGEEDAVVQITFILNNRTYEVMRQRRRERKTMLNVWENQVEITGATIMETQTIIEQLLGMNYETFTCTACIEQGKSDSFSALSPKEAKRVIMSILQLDIYDKYLQAVKYRANELAGKRIVSEGERDTSQLRIEELENEIKNSGQHKVQLEKIEKEQSVFQEKISTIEKQLYTLEKSLSGKEAESSKVLMYVDQLKDAVSNVKTKLTKIKKAGTKEKCPLCLTVLSREAIGNVVKEFESRLKKYETELSHSRGKLEPALVAIETETHDHYVLSQNRSEFENSVEGLRHKAYEVQDAIGFMRAKDEEIQKAKTRLEDIVIEVKHITRLWSQYNILTKAFDRNGIPTLIIENVIPEVEETTNRILAVLSSGTMTLAIITQRELKTGGVGDTLEIQIKLHGKTQNYDILSGGEKFRVDLALRIALSTVLARRNNFKCETLIVDEGFGSLDAMGRQKFVELSKALSDTFKRLIIITHTDLTDYYSNLVTVTKTEGVSSI